MQNPQILHILSRSKRAKNPLTFLKGELCPMRTRIMNTDKFSLYNNSIYPAFESRVHYIDKTITAYCFRVYIPDNKSMLVKLPVTDKIKQKFKEFKQEILKTKYYILLVSFSNLKIYHYHFTAKDGSLVDCYSATADDIFFEKNQN